MDNKIKEIPQYHMMQEDLRNGRCIQLEGCVPSQTQHLLSTLKPEYDYMIVTCMDELQASEFSGGYLPFDPQVLTWPALDPVFSKADIQGSFLMEQRMEVLRKLYEGEPCTIVTTLDAFFEKLQSAQQIRQEIMRIRIRDTLDREDLARALVSYGYEHETQVTGHGEFSIRGSIIDIYPYASDVPYRIDLFGDEVDTIRSFDPQSQISQDPADGFVIFPEIQSDQDEDAPEGGFLDYFQDKKTLFVLMEPARMLKAQMGMNPLTPALDTPDPDTVTVPEFIAREDTERALATIRELTQHSCIVLSSLGESLDAVTPFRVIRLNARNIPSYNGRFSDLVSQLRQYRKDGYQVILECASEARKTSLVRSLVDHDLYLGPVTEDRARGTKASDIQVCTGSTRIGFEYPDLKFALITEVDIFGARKAKRRRRRYSGDPIREFTDLNIGDYVVHEQHGVGIYQGIERIKLDGIEKDYMKIGYAQNSSLYVLATQFDKIQKYGAAEGARPKLNRLGGKEWTNTRERVRAAVQDIAEDLVRLYAARQLQKGFIYSRDTVWQKEFEESFEYEETDDQLHAIEDVKNDMQSGRIMDRLICGDVGFGKTEVAIRAAFKAVQDGKQVAFLTPTTILAQQHFNTLEKRLGQYPVTIRMMSRFLTPAQTKQTIRELAAGQCDIVVGTHKLLSKDVKFRDLGLLIIDEEQRFGVTHKEKIKQLKKNVDVITLSATPIPRTLHMSLTGIRDMSLLTEPPVDRLPIQTYVMEYSDEAVKEAIIRETSRGGQVYYVYNRTGNIDLVADKIQKMLPHVRVSYAHGRMGSRDLENIMFDFIDRKIDVLVSTTIIETGLDIPNVNTIIIHDADNFGLSQLYQLRGRVGRSNRTAYAFLMYKKDKLIREVAEKRLKAIREFSDLGSGIRIAMRDLEIRGAGNVLGAEQSGHMEAVGYELYCKMLNQAVAALKGESPIQDFETTIDLDVDGFIPASYIPDESEKLNIYKRISAIETPEDMEYLYQELKDRFGPVPKVTENLMSVAFIKARAHECMITEIVSVKPQPIPEDASSRPAVKAMKKPKPTKAFRVCLVNPLPEGTYDPFRLIDIVNNHPDIVKMDTQKGFMIYQPGSVPGDQPGTPPGDFVQIKATLMQLFDILKTAMTEGGSV